MNPAARPPAGGGGAGAGPPGGPGWAAGAAGAGRHVPGPAAGLWVDLALADSPGRQDLSWAARPAESSLGRRAR